MTLPHLLPLDGPREFISKIQIATKNHRLICDSDLPKFATRNVPSLRRDLKLYNINECDVKHLTLESIDHKIQEINSPIPELNDWNLPRALLLRNHVFISTILDTNIQRQLTTREQTPNAWTNKYLLEVTDVLEEWITWKKRCQYLLHRFARDMESIRPIYSCGEHILHVTFVNIIERESEALGKILHSDTQSSQAILDLMCADCKEFALKSIQTMNALAPHFKTILYEYYSNPEVADKQHSYIEAVQRSESILESHNLSFKIDIQCRVLDSRTQSLGLTSSVTRGLNKTIYSMYDPNKYPDEKGLILFLTLSIEKVGQLPGDEMGNTYCIAPVFGSVVYHASNYNFEELNTLYNALMVQQPIFLDFNMQTAEELREKVSTMNRIFESVLSDLDEYFVLRDKNGRIIINECDVEHLNLQPMQRGETESITLGQTVPLPRALKLRKYGMMVYAYKDSVNSHNQIHNVASVLDNCEPETRERLLHSVTEMFSLADRAHRALEKFAWTVEKERKSLIWGKNNLHLACELVFRAANDVMIGVQPVEYKRSENEISLLCNHCKLFELKSGSMLNELSKQFGLILSNFYEDPESAKNSAIFHQFVQRCNEILEEFDFTLKVSITDVLFDEKEPPRQYEAVSDLNISQCRIYHPNRFPDNKNKGWRLNVYLVRIISVENSVMDLNSPLPYSVTGIYWSSMRLHTQGQAYQ